MRPLTYGSICSGIEAATVAWEPLGWRPAFFAEIDKFPSAVLAHHYPEVPNFGDFTTITRERAGSIDLLVGGTPCQSFSVAGKRAGLDDPRGNLTLEFLALAARLVPRWIVWENVPGVLSDDGGRTFGTVLDTLNDMGYSVECDILDACHFGVPQRRRRVFVVAESVAHGQKKKTLSFASMAAQCLTELSLGVLAAHCDLSSIGGKSSAWPSRFSSDGVARKMRLFGLASNEADTLASLLSDMVAARANGLAGRGNSGSLSRRDAETQALRALNIAGEGSQDIATVKYFSSIPWSWSRTWVAVCDVVNAFTTSTMTSETIESRIFTCAVASLSIARFTLPLIESFPNLFDGESSGLTALRAFTNYARQAASTLFGRLAGLFDWPSFVESATPLLDQLERCLGDRAYTGTLFPIPESLLRHPAPSREAGAAVAALTSSGVGTCGADDNQAQAGHLIAHTLRAEGYDASEDGTGRGIPLVAHALNAKGGAGRSDGESETFIPTWLNGRQNPITGEQCGPLDCHPQTNVVAFNLRGREDGAQAEPADVASLRAASGGSSRSYVAFDETQITSRENRCNPQPGDPSHPLAAAARPLAIAGFTIHGTDKTARVASETDLAGSLRTKSPGAQENSSTTVAVHGATVRRLTPRECERLQGFPDVQKTAIISVWDSPEKARNFAAAEARSLKLQSSVLHVEGQGLKANASAAGGNSSTHHLGHEKPVDLSVLVNLERSVVEIHRAGRLLWSASTAAARNESPLRMPIGDFVQLVAPMLQTLEAATLDGGAESLPSTSGFSLRQSGRKSVSVCGQEIDELAGDADRFTREVNRFTKSITSLVGPNSPICERLWRTWSSCVVHATSSCIPEEIRSASSYTLNVTIEHGYTLIPYRGKPAADGPRYKALGNSMAVPCMSWIGERIAAVDSILEDETRCKNF